MSFHIFLCTHCLCLSMPVSVFASVFASMPVCACLCMPVRGCVVRGCVWGALSRETIESLIGVRAAALQGEGQL